MPPNEDGKMGNKKPYVVTGKALVKVNTYIWAEDSDDAGNKAIADVIERIGSLNTNAPLSRNKSDDLLDFKFSTRLDQQGEKTGE